MDTISMIRSRAASDLKTVVLPEINDERTLEAAKVIRKEKIANVLLLEPDKVDAQEKEKYAQQYYELRKAKGMTIEQARQVLQDPLYIADMMARNGVVDGCVAGASHTTADVARAAIHCFGINEKFGIASSCFIMAVPDCEYGEEGTFVFSDCGIIPDPKKNDELKGGHALCIMGYDDSKNLFKFKNSWGSAWGDGGYGYLTYDYMKQYCVDAWSDTDLIENPLALVRNIENMLSKYA